MNSIKNILMVCLLALLFVPGGRAQMRFENSISLTAGVYAASGFGTNSFLGARYNYYILGGKYFVEASFGISSLRSKVLESVTQAQVYASERLYTYEFVGAYDPNPSGMLPYFAAGVAGLNLGGQSSFAGVIGLGKRIPLYGMFGTNQLGVRYDVRDQIFSQSINNAEPFLSHNLAFTVGMQFYF